MNQRTLKRRADEMSKTRVILSAESSIVLLETELKSLGKEEKDPLLKSAGIRAEDETRKGASTKGQLGVTMEQAQTTSRYKVEK